jgi:hypothetical protein
MQEHGLFHPVLLTSGFRLVAGERRVLGAKQLGWPTIPATIVDIKDLLSCEGAENIDRKSFCVSERVALAMEFEKKASKRRGGDRTKSKSQKLDTCSITGRTDDFVARKAGFNNRQTYREAKFVVENGIPTLIEAMDAETVSIHRANQIAHETAKVQQALIHQLNSPETPQTPEGRRPTRSPNKQKPAHQPKSPATPKGQETRGGAPRGESSEEETPSTSSINLEPWRKALKNLKAVNRRLRKEIRARTLSKPEPGDSRRSQGPR